LAKGKTYKVEVFLLKETIQCEALVSENIENELYRQCRRELDGDMFGYRVKIDDKTQYDDYGIDINCLKTKTYKSEALNKIINDINTYKMWEIIYQ
jgi:hypothetical protein